MKAPRNMIGPKLRQIRFERGLTQPALAAMCQLKGWDMSRDMLARIEGQSRWVADFELVFLANVLELTTGELLPDSKSAGLAKKMVSRLERRVE
ncbi:MAG: helix-turn-helix transcriptional regulator [Chthoniobacteraceae bacterium]|nr:helix-turn-helix transcriptional regulator [Chthoniobacteraceae bacterium]